MIEDWRQEQYFLHSKLPVFKRRVQEAIDTIKSCLTSHPGIWGVSFSGGKDSTVLLDLCVHSGWRGPVLWQSYGELETLPDNRRMVAWAKEFYNLEIIEVEAPGELEVYREVGHFFVEPETKEERAAVRRWYNRSFRRLDKIVVELGWTGQFLGLRMEESAQRRKMLGNRGPLYYASTRKTWTACPLYRWQGRDIWAYLVSNNLPWADVYNEPGDPERLRNDIVFLAGSGSIRHGQFAHWKRTRPDWFRMLAKEFPEIRALT